MFNPLKYLRNRKVGLALGSGGAKGLAHVSVIEYLTAMNVPIDMIAGSSIGAVVGALYAAGTMGHFKEDILKLSSRKMLSMVDPVLPRSGLIKGEGIMKFLSKYLPVDMNIEDLSVPLTIVATDFEQGRPVLFTQGSVLEALRASISIPGVFVPYRYRSSILIDGGASDPLPVNIIQRMGADISIAVNLHPRLKKKRWIKSSVKHSMERAHICINAEGIPGEACEPFEEEKSGKNINWLTYIEDRLINTGKSKRKDKSPKAPPLPSIFEVMTRSIDIMELINTMLIIKYNSPNVIIEPDLMDVATLDFTNAQRMFNEGHLAAERSRSSLQRRVRAWV